MSAAFIFNPSAGLSNRQPSSLPGNGAGYFSVHAKYMAVGLMLWVGIAAALTLIWIGAWSLLRWMGL